MNIYNSFHENTGFFSKENRPRRVGSQQNLPFPAPHILLTPAQTMLAIPNEVGVNLKDGYNGDLTSREAGSVGGQMVKNVFPI